MRKEVYSFIAYTPHGKVLGFIGNKPIGSTTVKVFDPYTEMFRYVDVRDIGRYERYNLPAINRISKEKQEMEMEVVAYKKKEAK